jgi:hypothetical protein
LYNNNQGIQDKFIQYWVHIAKKFSNNKYVMGFVPINEPQTGIDNFLQAVYHIYDGKADKDTLQPLYARIYKEAMKVASNSSIMHFEPVIFPDVIFYPFLSPPLGMHLMNPIRNVSFTKPPGAEIGSPRHSLNGHTYCC